ncbi:MAG: NYN domain-containing protein [bacterium]
MTQIKATNIALYIDFDNIALGVRDAHQRFDIQLVTQRLLEKGKIIVKRAYADWSHHKEYMTPLHEAGIELIEIPARHMTGKNSADIRLVVDAMDICYSKQHLDTFVIVSGDSDFSPLVSKLRENAKQVIGVGVKNSTSKLLVSNCDEFIFYDDLYQGTVGRFDQAIDKVPGEKRKLFNFLLVTTQRLLQEVQGVLYSSLIKDTMKRKQPDFNEGKYGYSTFGDLLEDAMHHGLLDVVRDNKAGGTWVVQALGKGKHFETGAPARASEGSPAHGSTRMTNAPRQPVVETANNASKASTKKVRKKMSKRPIKKTAKKSGD